MGALLSLLRQNTAVSTHINLNFEDSGAVQPTASEQSVHTLVSSHLEKAATILQQIRTYAGCGEAIRKAISSPSPDTELEAWKQVSPAVGQLKDFYDFSFSLDECMRKVLQFLCTASKPSPTSETPATAIGKEHSGLEQYQATVHLLSRLLVFALDFDDLKISNPAIQNDFSYYRRTLSRLKATPDGRKMLEAAVVKDDVANRMSLFYAYPTPMVKCLVDGISDAVKKSMLSRDEVVECLRLMATICHCAVAEQRVTKAETIYFCLRFMIACIILFDHVHTRGVFVKESEVQVKAHIKLIQTHGGAKTDALLNALRYTTVHLNDESTPKAIKAMLATPQPQ